MHLLATHLPQITQLQTHGKESQEGCSITQFIPSHKHEKKTTPRKFAQSLVVGVVAVVLLLLLLFANTAIDGSTEVIVSTYDIPKPPAHNLSSEQTTFASLLPNHVSTQKDTNPQENATSKLRFFKPENTTLTNRMTHPFWCLPGGQRWARNSIWSVDRLLNLEGYGVTINGDQATGRFNVDIDTGLQVRITRREQRAPTCGDSISMHLIGPEIATTMLEPISIRPEQSTCTYVGNVTVGVSGDYFVSVVLDYVDGRAKLEPSFDWLTNFSHLVKGDAYKLPRNDVAFIKASENPDLTDLAQMIPGTPFALVADQSRERLKVPVLPHPVLAVPLLLSVPITMSKSGESGSNGEEDQVSTANQTVSFCDRDMPICGPGIQRGRWVHYAHTPPCVADLTPDDNYIWAPSDCRLKKATPEFIADGVKKLGRPLTILTVGDSTMKGLTHEMELLAKEAKNSVNIVHVSFWGVYKYAHGKKCAPKCYRRHPGDINVVIGKLNGTLESIRPDVVVINSMLHDVRMTYDSDYYESVDKLLAFLSGWVNEEGMHNGIQGGVSESNVTTRVNDDQSNVSVPVDQDDESKNMVKSGDEWEAGNKFKARRVFWMRTVGVHEGMRARMFLNNYRIAKMNERVDQLCARYNIPLIDAFSPSFGRPDRARDGMHTTVLKRGANDRAKHPKAQTREGFCSGQWFDQQQIAYGRIPETVGVVGAHVAYNAIFGKL